MDDNDKNIELTNISNNHWFDAKSVKPIPNIRVIIKDQDGFEYKDHIWDGNSWICCEDGIVIKTGNPATLYFTSNIDVFSWHYQKEI